MQNKERHTFRLAFWRGSLLCVALGCVSAHGQKALSVHEAVQQALQSPAAQVANARVDEVRGSVRQAGLGPNPRLFLQSEDLRPWASDYDFPTQTEDYGFVSQTIEVDGKRGKRVMLANARLRQAEAERAIRLRQIAAGVSTAYWNAVSLQRIADLLTDDMESVEEMVRYHKKRVDNGAMRGVDLLRIEIERDRLAIALQTAQRDAAQGRLEVFRQMGVVPMNVTLSDSLDGMPQLAPVDLKTALQQRPEIVAAQDAVNTAEADLKLQKAMGVPDPDLIGGYKRNSADNTLYAALQFSLPIRNRNQGEVDRARASVNTAQAGLALAQAQITTEVQQAQATFAAQQKIIRETLPDMRAHAQLNLDIISEAYRIGGVDLLRFIDAERTKFDVEVSAARALAQLQQSAIQLQLAYGVQP